MHSLARQALLQTGYAGKIEHADKGARWPEQWAEVLGIPEGTAAGTRDGAVPADAVEVARLVIATVRKFRESADGEPGRQHLPYLAGPGGSPLSESVLSYARQAWADISGTGNARLLAAGRALRVEHDDYLKVWALSRPRIDAAGHLLRRGPGRERRDARRRPGPAGADRRRRRLPSVHLRVPGRDRRAEGLARRHRAAAHPVVAVRLGRRRVRQPVPAVPRVEAAAGRQPRAGYPAGRAAEPDAILCRTNATAVAEVFAGLESGKRTALAGGGDAIKEIAKAARDLQAGKGTRHPDLSRFADWDEVRHYAQNDEDGKSLQVFVRLIDRHGPGGLIDMIGRLTPEGDTRNPPQLTISTAHKAKGLEWDVVRVAGDFRGPVTDPETGEVTWPAPEERRLAYVAATRARKLLEPGSLSWIYDYPLPGARLTQGPAQGKDREAQAAAPELPASSLTPPPKPGRSKSQPRRTPRRRHWQGQGTAGQPTPPSSSTCTRTSRSRSSSRRRRRRPANRRRRASHRAAGPGRGKGGRAGAGQPAGAAAVSQQAAGAGNSSPQGEADAVTRLRALAGQHGLTVMAEQLSPTNTLITITDGDRIVLLHDDISGHGGGRHPDRPRRGGRLPGRAAGVPGPASAGAAGLGPPQPGRPGAAVPVGRAGDRRRLRAHRAAGARGRAVVHRLPAPGFDSGPFSPSASEPGCFHRPGHRPGAGDRRVPARPPGKPSSRAGLAALGKRGDWASQLTALAPYLINGTSLHSAEARRHVAAAADAAALDDARHRERRAAARVGGGRPVRASP